MLHHLTIIAKYVENKNRGYLNKTPLLIKGPVSLIISSPLIVPDVECKDLNFNLGFRQCTYIVVIRNICQSRDCNLLELRITDSTSRDSDRSFYQRVPDWDFYR